MRRLWDCIMLRDELDMLRMRLEEMAARDTWHVIVEATVDHQGHPKPLHYAENLDRFARWRSRIIHVVAADLPGTPDPWVREHAQRDRALTALAGAPDSDVVLIADVDEIPSRRALVTVPAPALALEQSVHPFAVDWYAFRERTSVLATVGLAREHGLSAVRDARSAWPALTDGGRHFTWVGGRERAMAKLDAFCHLEAREVVREGLATGAFIERGEWNVAPLIPVEVDITWPAMIRERRCPPEWFRPGNGEAVA